VVVDRFAYASCWATLLRLQAVTGVDLAVAPSGADGAVDPARLDEVVDDRTRLVLVTHVPTHVGTVSDVGAVGQLLAGGTAVYAVDASQSVGQIDVQVREIGCQVAFAPGRKFLRAPRGTGLLYVADELADDLVPISIDLTSAVSLDAGSFALRDGARRFDPFEHSLALRLGLGAAARHACAIGLERIQAGVEERSRAVADLVDRSPGVELLVPAPLSGIVSFVHDRLDPTEVRAQLAAASVRAWVASLGGSPLDQADRLARPAVRLSPHWDTTDEELEALERALGVLA
jgi:selenocysteine lyase/cysteine desulfurase